MRKINYVLASGLLAAALGAACDSHPQLNQGTGASARDELGGSGSEDPQDKSDIKVGDGGDSNPGDGETYVSFDSIRVEPRNDVLRVSIGEEASLDFATIGITDDGEEIDVTDRSVFYVPDLFLVGGFPADGDNTFSVRLPEDDEDYQQRGGTVTVQAQINNGGGEILSAETELTVVLEGAVLPEESSPGATPALPSDPGALFEGAPDPLFAPTLAYPNDGVLLPPNLGRLEVHFQPNNVASSLYQVSFDSDSTEIDYYTRCVTDGAAFEPDTCVVTIEGADYEHLAASNQGQGPVKLRVRGTDEAGNFGASARFDVEFAEERVDGAVYYWSTKTPMGAQSGTIVRFDFGGGDGVPEDFLISSDVPNNGRCIGCHALSRQGDKMLLGLSNSGAAELVFMNDLTRDKTDPDYFTYNGAESNDELTLLGAFNPSGNSFVTVRRRNAPDADEKLFFHSTETGLATSDITLPFVPSHPDWSPLGDKIAVTNISGSNSSTIEFHGGGISFIQRSAGVWNADEPVTLVPPESGKNRYAPNFVAGGELLLYSEVTCDTGSACDGYSDIGATTWAVPAEDGATPVHLARAAAPGVADGINPPPQTGAAATDFMDTFPKSTPFETEHNGKSLLWFTVSSQRRAGLRRQFPNPSVVGDEDSHALLWMFALDPEKIANGEDGSHPGFFLPFQDMQTSNHMAQWTEKFADAPPPPPPPSPPPPPAVPPPVAR